MPCSALRRAGKRESLPQPARQTRVRACYTRRASARATPMRCTLVVPGLLDWPSAALARVDQQAPALARLIAAASAPAREPDGVVATACRVCGIAKQQDWPVAPWLARAAGVDVGNAYWLCADPAQLPCRVERRSSRRPARRSRHRRRRRARRDAQRALCRGRHRLRRAHASALVCPGGSNAAHRHPTAGRGARRTPGPSPRGRPGSRALARLAERVADAALRARGQSPARGRRTRARRWRLALGRRRPAAPCRAGAAYLCRRRPGPRAGGERRTCTGAVAGRVRCSAFSLGTRYLARRVRRRDRRDAACCGRFGLDGALRACVACGILEASSNSSSPVAPSR